MPAFALTEAQRHANKMLAGPARHILLRGGSRSGKTFVMARALAIRAMKAPETRHAIFRLRFNHLKASVIRDTFPKMMKLCFPEVPYHVNQTDWFVTFPNKSQIIFGGLDEKDRTEKILGQEYATIYLNECSQISYDARNKVITRLAQRSELALKAYYDANPPTVASWLYRMFEQRVEPKSGEALAHPEAYATMMMNPDANRANLSPDYIAELESLPEKDKRRFLFGEYLSHVDGALWTLDRIKRVAREQIPQMTRIVVAVDPSGCSGPEDTRSDEIGIVVAGRDAAGRAYVLEDASGRYSPKGWGDRVIEAFDTWDADKIVAERNYGGAMVESTVRTSRATAPVEVISTSRGKHVRAEPVAALYEQHKVWHLGSFPDMEEQLMNFSASGYQGAKSPDRADAMIYALTELLIGGSTYDSTYAWL
ncbi:MAG: phage terminase large subunit [Janthinobacterium lividum]